MGRHLGRRRPISCKLCRERKLRCSRHFPCSNCAGRGLVCQYERDQTVPSPLASSDHGNAVETSPESTRAELLERLEKLEALLETETRHAEPADSEPCDQPVPLAETSSTISLLLQRLTSDMALIEKPYSGQSLPVRAPYESHNTCSMPTDLSWI